MGWRPDNSPSLTALSIPELFPAIRGSSTDRLEPFFIRRVDARLRSGRSGGCLGLPTIAALEQGIPVIAVRENRNLMRNDLSHLPWQKRQFIPVDNYLEAVGVMNALKAGVALESVRRPIEGTKVRKAIQEHGQSAVANQ